MNRQVYAWRSFLGDDMSPHISKLNRHQLNSVEKAALPRDKSPTRDFIKKHPEAMVKLYQTQHPKVFPPADKVRLFKDKVSKGQVRCVSHHFIVTRVKEVVSRGHGGTLSLLKGKPAISMSFYEILHKFLYLGEPIVESDEGRVY